MATQRLTVATISGVSGQFVQERFHNWLAVYLMRRWSEQNRLEMDSFCLRLKANSLSRTIVYFCEWIDGWLMGNNIPGPCALAGKHFELWCGSLQRTRWWANQIPKQFQEQDWLRSRLTEAVSALQPLAGEGTVVVIREVLDGTVLDEEVKAALQIVPDWLKEK